MTDNTMQGYSDIELRLEREDLFSLMLMAHHRDLTLNQMIEQILAAHVAQVLDNHNSINDQGTA